MTVYIVTRQSFSEGSHGDLEFSTNDFIGVFSSMDAAQTVADLIPPVMFYAQFGNAEQKAIVTPMELDALVLPQQMAWTGRYEEYTPEDDGPYCTVCGNTGHESIDCYLNEPDEIEGSHGPWCHTECPCGSGEFTPSTN